MRNSIAIIALALALGGCSSSQTNQRSAAAEMATQETQQEPSMHGGMTGGDMAAMCPMAVEGTTVRAEDVEGGAALVFTTTGDVDELRQRVARMAEMHNHHHGEGHGHGMGMHGGEHGAGGHRHGAQGGGEPVHRGGMHSGSSQMSEGMMMPPSTARSEEVERGARLVFTPRDSDLESLRDHVGRHAEMMSSGRCPMMSGSGRGDDREPSDHESHPFEGGH